MTDASTASRGLTISSARLADETEYSFDPSLVAIWDSQGGQAESVRALRTHLVAQHIDEGRRAITVCGASADAGCTFVASNLAVAFSQIGLRTLLVDCDLRSPALDRVLRPAGQAFGLQQYLVTPDMSFTDVISFDVLPNLSVMYSGGAASYPQELLAGARFRGLMNFCFRSFDLTVIDTPPANLCSDARLVSAVAGYSLIVARKDKSFVADIKTLADQLKSDGVRVIGTVLNAA